MTAPMQIERLTRYGDPPPAAPPLPWMRWSDHEGLWIETVEHLQARIDERVKGMVAEHPIMPVDEWTEDECLEAVEWASDKGSDRTPSAITRHLDAIRRDR